MVRQGGEAKDGAEMRQSVMVVVCSRPGQECQDCGEEGRTCSQQYSSTRLQVFGDNRRDLVWEQFLFPSNCTCTPDNKTNNL